MSTKKETFICKRCLAIDWCGLTRPVASHLIYDYASGHNKHLCILKYTKGCVVCELLCHPASDLEEIYADELQSYPFKYTDMPAVQDSWALVVQLGMMWTPTLTVRCVPEPIDLRSSVHRTWDHDMARKWIRDCIESHTHWHDDDSAHVRHMNISLIDCVQRVIVDAKPSHRWIALSYVWGARPQTSAKTGDEVECADGKLPQGLPLTVEDAIAVTQQLGFQYLWVDEYCIDQQHAKRQLQIAEMDKVYHDAELTIVAAAGEDKHYGLPGVGATPRKRIKVVELDDVTLYANSEDPEYRLSETKWFTRGWTLQEGVLSRRVLLFTDHQTLFYCPAGYATEGLGEFLIAVDHCESKAARSSLPAPDTSLDRSSAWDYFHSIVSVYSARNITYDSDALSALLGIFKNIRRLQPSAYHLVGLPFFDSDNRSNDVSLPHIISDALSWVPAYATETLTRRSTFPSWTWVGWKGAVVFESTAGPKRSFNKPLIRNVHFASHNGEIPSALIFTPASGRTDNVQSALDDITTIMFHAPILSAEQYQGMCNSRSFYQPFQQNIVKKLRSGAWACVYVSICQDSFFEQGNLKEFLIVEWKENGVLAERVAFIHAGSRYSSPDDWDSYIQNLERREVHLI